MNLYTFGTILVLTIGLGAVSLWLFKELRKALDRILNIVKEVLRFGKPVPDGFGDVCRAIAGRIDVKRTELEHLRNQITSLTQEVERLRNRQIRVDQIQAIFQVAFFQSQLSSRDFVKEVLRSTGGGVLTRREDIEYFGVYRASNIQRFGVDLKSLSFRLMPSSVIEVSGLGKTEIIGNLKTEVKVEHTELRRHLTGGKLPNAHEILESDTDNLLLDRDRKQRDDVHEAITQTRSIDQIDRAVEKMTLQFLNDHFAPRGYRVVKAIDGITDGKSIFQLSDEINGQLEGEIAAKNRLLSDALQNKSEVDQELRNEIQSLKEAPLANSDQLSPTAVVQRTAHA